MNNNSIAPTISKLESLFSKFNNHLYKGELHKPVITVSPDTTKGAYGWFTTQKVWTEKSSDNAYYEINICADYLHVNFYEICDTLLHEMCHLYAEQMDIKDTSRGGTYHNKHFKMIAEEHGLNVERDDKYGWTKTSLNNDTKLFIDSIKDIDFMLSRLKFEDTKSIKPSSSRKYVCPKCNCKIRATKDVYIKCGECELKMEKEI